MGVANMLRSAIESLEAPKCRALGRQEEIYETCNSPQASSSSDSYNSARSDAYASHSSGHASGHHASSHNSNYNYNSGSHSSHSSHGSFSVKSKSADGNVRL